MGGLTPFTVSTTYMVYSLPTHLPFSLSAHMHVNTYIYYLTQSQPSLCSSVPDLALVSFDRHCAKLSIGMSVTALSSS